MNHVLAADTVSKLHGEWDNPSVCKLKKAYQQCNIISRLAKRFPPDAPFHILEFGPGLGCLIELIKASFPNAVYHVVDLDSAILEQLVARHPTLNTHHVRGIRDLESVHMHFDVIVAIDVWEHLPTETAMAYSRWCWSVLAAEGVMLLQVPNWACPVTPATFYSDLTHCSQFNEISILQLMVGAGIPASACRVYPRQTPGCLGTIRDKLNLFFGYFYRLVFVFFGSVRLSVFSADLILEVYKQDHD